MILPSVLLLSQCATIGGNPSQTASVCPTAAYPASPIQVTLLPPQPIRLETAQIKQLEAVRKLVARQQDLSANRRNNGRDDPMRIQQQMQLAQEMTPCWQIKQGINLRMRLTNTGKVPVILLYGQDTGSNDLTVRGPGAVNLCYCGSMPADYRPGRPVNIAPGGSRELIIADLKHGHRDLNRWFITRPGEYEIRLVLSGLFKVDRGVEAPRRNADGNIIVIVDPLQNGYTWIKVTSNPVTFKVTQEGK